MSNIIDELLGRSPQKPGDPRPEGTDATAAAVAALVAEDAQPEGYRPYLARAIPQLGFVLVEKSGTMHGIQYPTISRLRHERRGGAEQVSFHADGLAVVMEGRGLSVIFRALVRHTLLEAREYDGTGGEAEATRIDRLGVVDTVPELRPSR